MQHVACYKYTGVSVRLTTTDMSVFAKRSYFSLFSLFFLITNTTTDGLSEALFKVKTTIICFNLFFVHYLFFKVTTNISSSNFVGFTKKSLKAESILDCASRCVYWEQRSSYCNAFRCFQPTKFQTWKLSTLVCKLLTLTNFIDKLFLKTPKLCILDFSLSQF